MTPYARQVTILHVLRSRTWITAVEFSRRFDVTVRTIYRDIEALSAAGIPIDSMAGPQGGYRLASDRVGPPLTLDADEAFRAYAMSVVFGSDTATGAPLGEKGWSRAALTRLGWRLHLDTSDWYWEDESALYLPTLRAALLANIAVELTMADKHRTVFSAVEVEPLGLVWKSGEWYLVGRQMVSGAIDRFRTNLIAKVRTTNRAFSFPDDFDLRAWWSHEMQEFGRGDIAIVIEAEPDVRSELLRLKFKPDSEVVTRPDGHLELRLFVDSWRWLVPLLASFGPAVAVREPEELVAAMREHFRASLSRYGSSAAPSIRENPMPNDRRDHARLRATRGRAELDA